METITQHIKKDISIEIDTLILPNNFIMEKITIWFKGIKKDVGISYSLCW